MVHQLAVVGRLTFAEGGCVVRCQRWEDQKKGGGARERGNFFVGHTKTGKKAATQPLEQHTLEIQEEKVP
jgi:hypothetical protein